MALNQMTFRSTSGTPRPASWAAKFPGTCGVCRNPIALGQLISRRAAGGYAHVNCAAVTQSAFEKAWDAELERNEWFDGEEEIAAAAKEAFLISWADAEVARRIAPSTPAPVATPAGLDLRPLGDGDHYVAVPNDQGPLTFLRISVLPAGKWQSGDPRPAGWVFCNQYLGGQGVAQRLGKQRPGGAYEGQWANLLTKVLADPREARMTFARELGRCFSCGSDLTDELSRTRGQGPTCYAKAAAE